MAVSPEKIDLLDRAGPGLQRQRRRRGRRRAASSSGCRARPRAAPPQLLADGWDEDAEGPRPVIWSPAASSLGRGPQPAPGRPGRAADGRRGHAVHAHPARDRHARADGRGARLARQADRLGRHPRPRPGPGGLGAPTATPSGARSGSARPTRTSRPAACPRSIAQNYAATGKTDDLSLEDLASRRGRRVRPGVESAVVHYGDTTLTFLNNWYRADQRGTALQLRLGRRRRGEVGHRLQHRQPRRRARPGRGAAAAADPARRRSTPRRARSSRTTPSSSSTPTGWTTAEARGRRARSRTSCSSPRTRRGCSSSASGRATPTSPSARRSSPSNGVDPDQPADPAARCPSPPVLVAAARRLGASSARGPGCCS